MTTFTADNKEMWKKFVKENEPQRPSVSKRVIVIQGRKHKNKEGLVFWHGRDKYSNNQYGSAASDALRDIIGRDGWRVGIETYEGERFFVNADYVEVQL